MNELIVSDVLQDLDQRHEHLLTELDELNRRVEQALNSLNKPSEPVAEEASDSTVTSGDRDGHSC
jgi:hypothetical protein